MEQATRPVVSPRRTVTVEPAGEPRQYRDGVQNVTFVPLSIKRRHNRKLLTPPPGAPALKTQATLDASMIKMLGKAFYWQRLIDSGEVLHASDLARKLKLEPGWVAEVLRLTLLAPDIVEAVVEGKQPPHLHFHLLRGREDLLPRMWQAQRELLGLPFR
ncbi:hypothetical protein [Eleftheria terrae]|uniref:hypothetical protein n=1 Tax=Eleftheria terrae TaxID=1597781 RepID=UPI00263A580D|nr:hypothetical protein [Eleftheria terrae]WKB50891.1 hypothetical protein N7L95_13830 [Eleftheria terrae]